MPETADKLLASSPQAKPADGTGRLSMQEATEILLREQSSPSSSGAAPVRRTIRPVEEEPATAAFDTPERTDAEPAEVPETEAAEPVEPTTEEPEGPTEEDPEYEIPVGDKVEKVRLSELQNGYLRQSDYSRKTADLATARKAFETDQREVRQERQAYAQLLGTLKRQIEEGQQPINWEELRRTDPVGFLEQRELQRERQAKLAAIREEEQRLQETQQREYMQQVQAAQAQATQVLFQRIPTWQKPEVRQQEVSDLIRMAREFYGYSQEEIDRIIDPRFVLMGRDALLYHRSRGTTVSSKRLQPQPGRPVPAKRSVPASDPNIARKQATQAQFARKPSIHSAVDAILAERGEE